MSVAKTLRAILLGSPPDPDHQPDAYELYQKLAEIEAQALLNGGLYFEDTLANLNAVTGMAAGDTGFVLDDPTPANEGIYLRGASTWDKTAELPDAFTDAVGALAAVAVEEAARIAADAALDARLDALELPGNVSTADLAAGAVTLPKMADLAEARIIGRAAGAGTGAPQDLTAAQGRAALGLGTASQSAAGDFAPASHTHIAAGISDSTAAGRALLTAADVAAQRTALGLGTAATTAAASYATAAQGALADTATQPEDLGALASLDTVSSAHIDAGAVGLTKMADRADGTLLGRKLGAGVGAPQEVTPAEGRALLGLGSAATTAATAYATAAQGALADTSVQPGDAVSDLAETAGAKIMTAAERTKLSGIATAATANATDAALRDRATHTGVQEISTIAGLQAALDGRASASQGALADTALQGAQLSAEAAARDKADVVEVWRPGEDVARFSEAATGAPENRDQLSIGTATVNDFGAVLRLTGGDADPEAGYADVVPRAAYAIELDRVYEARLVVQRAIDPGDPAGHGVEFRGRNLSASKAHVSNIALAASVNLTVAMGRTEIAVYVCRGTPPAGVTAYAPPTSARYLVPFVRIYGNGATTDVELIQWRDVTDTLVEQASRVAGDGVNAASISAHAALANNPHSVTKAQVGLGNADNTSDLAKPISTATQTALNSKADEVDLQAEVSTRTLLVKQIEGEGFVVTDEGGFVLLRVNEDGALRTPLHDLGVDLTGGFVLKDVTGFVALRVTSTGEVSFGGPESFASRAGQGMVVTDAGGFVSLRVNAAGQTSFGGEEHFSNAPISAAGMIITDPAGFVTLRVDDRGRVSFGGPEYFSTGHGTGLVIRDAAGFVGFRYDENGLKVDGLTPTEMAVTAASEVELARNGVLRHSPLGLMAWRKGRGAVIQGTGEARILCIGDSNTATSGHETGTQRRRNSYPAALARILDQYYDATWAGIYGSAGQGAAYPVFDPRVTMGAGWSPLGAVVSLGGEVFANTTTTSALSFAPGVEWDVAEVTVIGLGAGALTMDIGGATTPFSATSGAATVLTFSAGSVGQHTLNINRVSGGTHVASWVFRNTLAPAVTVVNGGRGGWQSSDIIDTTSFYSPGSILPTVDCDVVLIEIGINDHTAGVTPAAFAVNLQTIIDLCPPGADVVLVSSVNPSEEGKAYPWADYRAQMKALATLNNLPMIDMTLALGDRSVIEANGWNADAVHPTFAGLAEKALTCAKLLLS